MPDNHHLSAAWYGIDFRKNPKLYRIGRGEQGVLTAQPYKAEILPYWRFRTPMIADWSSKQLWRIYKEYREAKDYVGMDMLRKFMQMGYTRSMRYANHKSGKKYNGPVPIELRGVSGAHGREQLPIDHDPVKRLCALYFEYYLGKINNDPQYKEAKRIINSWK